jgi:hypothetical protein
MPAPPACLAATTAAVYAPAVSTFSSMESSISDWCCTSTARSWNSAATSLSDLRATRREAEEGGAEARGDRRGEQGSGDSDGCQRALWWHASGRHMTGGPHTYTRSPPCPRPSHPRSLSHLTSISTSLARDCASVYACCASSDASSRMASRMTPEGSLDASCSQPGG